MPLPNNAKKFPDPIMDPHDRVEFLLTLDGTDGLLEAGETIASYTLTVRAEGVALGLTLGTTTYAPSLPTNTQIKFWLEVDAAFQANAAYDGEGVLLGVEVSVVTSSTPARRRQRTVAVQVAQQ